MRLKNYLKVLTFFLIVNYNCSKNESDSLAFEQNVFENIFPELIDRTFKDKRKVPLPPEPGASNIEMDSLHKAYENYIKVTKFKPLYVIVEDSIEGLSKVQLKKLYEEGVVFIDTIKEKKTFKIDLSQINIGENYILKYKSQISKPIKELRWDEINKEDYLREYSGEISFSRIYFDSNKSIGFLYSVFYCGGLCGESYKIYIKKVNDKWVIENVESNGFA